MPMHCRLCAQVFFIAIPVILAILYSYVVVPPQHWAEGTTGSLLGEVHIQHKEDAFNFANDAVAESLGIWKEPSTNWQVMHNVSNLLVEVRRITEGPYASSGIVLSRAVGTVKGADPDEVYQHFISPEGLQLLDPNMDPAEVEKYIERYDWEGFGNGAHLDVHESFMRDVPPGVEERYYIVLNGYYTGERLFFCKSIVHDSRPGSSPYFDPPQPTDDPRVRLLNTFYFHITPTSDGSMIKMVNYVDLMAGSTIPNWLVGMLFFPGVYDRIEEKFGISNTATS